MAYWVPAYVLTSKQRGVLKTYSTGSLSVHVLKCETVSLIGTWLVDGVLLDMCSSFRVHHWALVYVYDGQFKQSSWGFRFLSVAVIHILSSSLDKK